MLKEIDQKINEIMAQMYDDLFKSGTIDAEKNILKPQTFLIIIEETEKKIDELVKKVEQNGSVVPAYRNAANIIFDTQSLLSEMKENMSMTPREQTFGEEPATAEQKTPKQPSKFGAGIKKFFGKLHGKKTTKNPTNTR